MKFSKIDELCINSIRSLSIDAIEKANSGHPGLPLGAAAFSYILWQYHLKHDPKNPHWINRDRFVLSPGHGSMLLYSLLHLTGYSLSREDIKNFRQWGSLTPGHPEFHLTPGVECTTGPLGQGAANAVGMAIAEKYLSHRLKIENEPNLINHKTYALVSDGDLMEGVSAEAASLAGHLKLGKLIYLYDSNDITLDGSTDLSFSTENVKLRFESYNWHVQLVENGDQDLEAIHSSIENAKNNTTQPSLIIFKTKIGYGSPKVGTSKVHGSPLNKEEIKKTKEKLNYPSLEPFFVPSEALKHFENQTNLLSNESKAWEENKDRIFSLHPELKKEWNHFYNTEDYKSILDNNMINFADSPSLATRESSGKVIQTFSSLVPSLIGGDADLSCSTNTTIKDSFSFLDHSPTGRNIHYGVREHAMAALANGMCYHGGIRPFIATFFCFSDYMKPSIRLAAMNKLPVIFIFTHDSIALGEDGPTHQPIEHLMALRVIPNLIVIRPADANETQEAWKFALLNPTLPIALVLTRQKVPTFLGELKNKTSELCKGAYILENASKIKPQCILIATGSEVHIALDVRLALEKEGIATQVVSMPSWDIFENQSDHYKKNIIPDDSTHIFSIEAGSTLGWERYTKNKSHCFGIDQYGASAPYPEIYDHYELTSTKIVNKITSLLKS